MSKESKRKNSILLLLIKGFCIGGSMLVPGVSGGSMAMILGIYDDLIHATSNLFKTPKSSFFMLLWFMLGSVVGFVIVANPLEQLLTWNKLLVMYLFIGAVVGSIPMILKKASVEKFKADTLLWIAIGIFSIFLIAQLPENLFSQTEGLAGMVLQIAGGILCSAALILPGISLSYMLVVMGIYEFILGAIASLNIIALLPFIAGLLIGIAGCVKVLSHLLKQHPRATYLMILGFVLASVVEIFPGIPKSLIDGFISMFMFCVGCLSVFFLSKNES